MYVIGGRADVRLHHCHPTLPHSDPSTPWCERVEGVREIGWRMLDGVFGTLDGGCDV